MTISVIISSYRGNEGIARSCIASLSHQTLAPDEILLVVDTPEEKEIFSRALGEQFSPSLRIISSGRKGLASARNCGTEISSGDIIAFIDDDATADPGWLSGVNQSFLENQGAAVVGGPVRPVFQGRQIPEKWNWIIGCTSRNPRSTRPVGCNMAIKREVFRTGGQFNESLGRVKKTLAIGEETDLFLRILEQMPGSTIVCNPHAVVFHTVPAKRTTLRYMIRRAYQEGAGKAIMGKNHRLGTEKTFLRHYLSRPDRYTIPVLAAVGAGFLIGMLTS
jgi:glycosyltransferase involved in cell wall biosynthesis